MRQMTLTYVIVTILECCVMFSGVKFSVRLFNLFTTYVYILSATKSFIGFSTQINNKTFTKRLLLLLVYWTSMQYT